jgi:two-component system phosphate regulon response regulator PhoB
MSRDVGIQPSILVVEDDPDNRELLVDYLRFVGCTVTTATTAVEAIAVAEVMRPDVVLMDLGLPGTMDGWEAARHVTSRPVLKDSVVIAVTAHGFPADIEKAMHAGCAAVVIKPYDLVALAQQVQRIVSQRQSAKP